MEDRRDAVSFHMLVLGANGASAYTQRQYLFYECLFLDYLSRRRLAPALAELNPQRVREFLLWYRSQDHPRRTRGGEVAARAAADILKRLGAILEENEVVEVNPLRKLQRPTITKFTRQPFTAQEINALWGACFRTQHPARDEALYLLLLDTGMRIGEATSLRLDRSSATCPAMCLPITCTWPKPRSPSGSAAHHWRKPGSAAAIPLSGGSAGGATRRFSRVAQAPAGRCETDRPRLSLQGKTGNGPLAKPQRACAARISNRTSAAVTEPLPIGRE